MATRKAATVTKKKSTAKKKSASKKKPAAAAEAADEGVSEEAESEADAVAPGLTKEQGIIMTVLTSLPRAKTGISLGDAEHMLTACDGDAPTVLAELEAKRLIFRTGTGVFAATSDAAGQWCFVSGRAPIQGVAHVQPPTATTKKSTAAQQSLPGTVPDEGDNNDEQDGLPWSDIDSESPYVVEQMNEQILAELQKTTALLEVIAKALNAAPVQQQQQGLPPQNGAGQYGATPPQGIPPPSALPPQGGAPYPPPGQGGYGPPPGQQGGYGPPPGQAPQQGGYGPPPGQAPQQGGYGPPPGQQGGGYGPPPGQAPQQGGYGPPPGQQGGGYGPG